MRALVLALAALLLPTTASATTHRYSGGGPLLHQVFVPYKVPGWAGGTDFPAPGLLNCIGGVGFAVEDGARLGGTGSYCAGSRGYMGLGGLQGGWQDRRAGFYGAAYATLGAGHLKLEDRRDVLATSFIYVQPTVAIGIPIGELGAVEGSLFGMIPAPVHQRLNGKPTTGNTFPHVGVQIAFLFGDFSAMKRHSKLGPPQDQKIEHTAPPPLEVEKPVEPPVEEQPEPPPPPEQKAEVEPQPAPVQPGRLGRGKSKRPLAVPGKGSPPSK
jgi:hypothetical protein